MRVKTAKPDPQPAAGGFFQTGKRQPSLPARGTVLGVDSGVGGAGYAVVGYLGKVVSLESAVIVNTSPKEFMAERLRQICAPLRGLIVSLGVKNVVIEKPVVYGNEISQAAAVKGDLHTLSFSVGAICLCCLEAGVSAENIELINPNQWKGQLSKGQVAERVYPLVDQHRFSLKSHSIDAAGIALWWLGMFV